MDQFLTLTETRNQKTALQFVDTESCDILNCLAVYWLPFSVFHGIVWPFTVICLRLSERSELNNGLIFRKWLHEFFELVGGG